MLIYWDSSLKNLTDMISHHIMFHVSVNPSLGAYTALAQIAARRLEAEALSCAGPGNVMQEPPRVVESPQAGLRFDARQALEEDINRQFPQPTIG